ncbi:MAG TPA: nickel/cobalt transporter [Xanthobacteraceae bacterium]|jgi:nickel/cobalt exporter|nr:nickel/cobalt transporter [Xanthobacteraceae bacterium]
MRIVSGGRATGQIAKLGLMVVAMLLLAALVDGALAQGSPFGGPRPGTSPVPVGGIVGWLFAKQAEFYRQFSGLIRASKADGSAAWSLMGLSFLYGIFHAAGPGHGKAVISSYLVANEETWVRGVVLSFLSALMQAFVAIAIVGVAAVLLHASAATMNGAVNWIETLSYTLIIVVGLRLLWVKGRAFISALRDLGRPTAAVGAAVTPAHAAHEHDDHDHHEHDHAHCDHGRHDDAHTAAPASCSHGDHDHDHGHSHHDHDHDDASAWGHAHAPEPEELAGPGGWRRGLTAIVAVGLRPCSGAILVLVFALAQGLFWVGAASTFTMGLGTFITVAAIATLAVSARAWAQRIAGAKSSYGTLAMRGIEAGAAVVIIAFGALLLGGYIVNERMVGF